MNVNIIKSQNRLPLYKTKLKDITGKPHREITPHNELGESNIKRNVILEGSGKINTNKNNIQSYNKNISTD